MIFCDYHIHTNFSFDADKDATVDAICKAAIKKGLTHIAITDHLDVNYKYDYPKIHYDAKGAREAILAAKEKYKDKLSLSYGIELGQAHHYPEDTKAILDENKFEFVISSLHNIRSMPDFYFYFKDNKDVPEEKTHKIYDKCLDEIIEGLELFGDRINTIGHITYMHRYLAECGLDLDFSQHEEKLEALFKLIIQKGVALELNTSTYYKGLGFTLPTYELMKKYYDMGGRLITVGSDAHTPENVGKGILDAIEELKKIGFDSLVCMRDGKTEIIKI